jgi:hypothetical protein
VDGFTIVRGLPRSAILEYPGPPCPGIELLAKARIVGTTTNPSRYVEIALGCLRLNLGVVTFTKLFLGCTTVAPDQILGAKANSFVV